MADKHPKRPRDLNQWAKLVTDIVSGEVKDREPAKPPKAERPNLGKKIRGLVSSVRASRPLNVADHPINAFVCANREDRGFRMRVAKNSEDFICEGLTDFRNPREVEHDFGKIGKSC